MGMYDDLVTSKPTSGGGLYDDLSGQPGKDVSTGDVVKAVGSQIPLVGQVQGAVKGAEKFLDKKIVKPVAGALAYGHNHPQEAIMGPLGAMQRGLRGAEVNVFGGGHEDVGHDFMTPKTGPVLQKKIQTQLGIQPGGPIDKYSPLLAKGARTTEDVVNDPLTVSPIGKIAKLIPGAAKAGEAVGKVAHAATGNAFNPDHYLDGLTKDGKAEYEAITNRAMEGVRAHKVADDKIIAAHADEIRKGVMPPEVAALFRAEKGQSADTAWKQYLTDAKGKLTFGPGAKPQDVSRALFASRAPEFKAAAMPELEKAGFFTSPSGVDAGRGMGKADKFTVPVDEIPELQKRLARNIESKIKPESGNVLVKGAQGLLKRGNQAFLANPVPHVGNLSNLAYNEYGPIRALQGLGNAARVATGTVGKDSHLAQNIGELEQSGAKSQYGDIFDELGLTRIAGIPHTEGAARAANKLIVPLQRASNYAQNKVLNSTETGLRAAALDAEKGRGVVGDQAAKNIHRTFGTNAPNAVTEGARGLAVPFAHFHGQTAPSSVLRTLASNPARISNPIKIQQDLNNKHGAQYHSTVPGANAGRMLADPVGYASSNLGGLLGILNPYSVVSALKSGKAKPLERTAQEQIGRFITGSPEIQAAIEMAMKKKGRAGESGLQDMGSAMFGGYWGKGR